MNWYYRVLNESFGPVSYETLVELAHAGSIGPRDEVRPEMMKRWQMADTIAGLFDEQASTDDLESMMAPNEEHAHAGDLDAMLASETPLTSLAALQKRDRSPGISRGNIWYLRTLGQDLGPFSFDHLLEMVATGELSQADSVRKGDKGLWSKAETIVGLFSDEPQPMEELRGMGVVSLADPVPQGHSSTSKNRNPAPARNSTTQNKRKAEPYKPQVPETTEEHDEPEWLCNIVGQQVGPFTLTEIKRMADEHELSRTDEIRHINYGGWGPAEDFVGLFPHEPPPPPPPVARAKSETGTLGKTPLKIKPPVQSVDDLILGVLSETIPREPSVVRTPIDTEKPATERPATSASVSSTTPRPETPRPAYVPPPPPMPAAKRAPMPPPKRASSGKSLSEMIPMNLVLPILGGIAGIGLLVGIVMFMPSFSSGGGSAKAAFKETQEIWEDIRSTEEKKGDWASLKSKWDPKLKEIKGKLEPYQDKNPLAHFVYSFAGFKLPKVLKQKSQSHQDADKTYKQAASEMEEGAKLLK